MKVKIKKDCSINPKLWYSNLRGKIFSVYKNKKNQNYFLTIRSLGQRSRWEGKKIYSALIQPAHCIELTPIR